MIVRALWSALAMVTAAPTAAPAADRPIAILHGSTDTRNEAGTATFVDPSTMKRLGAVTVGIHPVAGAFDAAQERLLVANSGDRAALSKWPAGTRASVSIVDVATSRRLADIPIPFRMGAVVVPAGDGAYVATSPGAKGGNSIALFIDRTTFEVRATVPIGAPLYVGGHPESHIAFASPSGGTVFVLRAPTMDLGTKAPFAGASNAAVELALLDARAGSLREMRRLAPRLSSVLFSDDRKHVYVLCLGDSRGPGSKKSRPSGRLFVLDAESGAELLGVDAGYGSPRLVLEPTGRDALLVVPEPASGSPHVALIRGTSVAGRLEAPDIVDVASLPGRPERLVLCEQEILVARAEFAGVARRLRLPFDAGAVMVAADGARAWVLERSGARFGAVSLPGLDGFRAFTSGRPEIKLGKYVASVATSVLLLGGAVVGGGDPGAVYVPRRSNLSLVPSSDARFVHVYNRKTEDVTVVDVASMTILDRDGVGDGASTVLIALSGGPGVLAIWEGGQAVVGVGAGNNIRVRKLQDLGGDAVSPPIPIGSEVWIVRKGGVEAISVRDGAIRGSLATPRTSGVVLSELALRGGEP